ncbi:hypothetical protein [Schinkia azotoformans]|uniref:hypothetical protein n=1 Tax=Schinkia azotoformans TaxID=1454 RepID=UPI002DB8AFC6|nr:hypothetical protein [Schinkia azotoformans]MEC1768303.1 hypothetical protein [Schinkia azotoformans]
MAKHKNVKWNCLYNYRIKKYDSFEEMLQAFLLESQEKLKSLKQQASRQLNINKRKKVVKNEQRESK